MKLPYKINATMEAMTLLMLLGATAASFWLYSQFPETVATHWNFSGEPDGYSGRVFAAFFFPAFSWGIYLLITFLPLIDPKRDRYHEFSSVYNAIRLLIVGLMVAIYGLTAASGLGYNVPIGILVPGLIGLLFIALGNFMPHIKRNWFVGIRTPWTISSEAVWTETHRIGGKIFMAAGAVCIIIPFLPGVFALPLFITTIVLLLAGTVGYSWWVWKKTQ